MNPAGIEASDEPLDGNRYGGWAPTQAETSPWHDYGPSPSTHDDAAVAYVASAATTNLSDAVKASRPLVQIPSDNAFDSKLETDTLETGALETGIDATLANLNVRRLPPLDSSTAAVPPTDDMASTYPSTGYK